MPYTISLTVSPDFKSGVNLTTLVESLRRTNRGEQAEAFAQLQVAIFNVERALRAPVTITSATIDLTGSGGELRTRIDAGVITLYDANGVEISRLDAALSINAQQVVGARGAAVAKIVSGPAGAVYGAAEQTMLNDLKAAVNLIIDRISSATGHGLIT